MISHEFGCDVATARRSSPAFAAQREGLEKVPLTGSHSRLLGATIAFFSCRPSGHGRPRPPGHPASRPAGQPASRPPGHPASRPPGHPATRPPGHPATRPPAHSHTATRPHGHPATRPPGHEPWQCKNLT